MKTPLLLGICFVVNLAGQPSIDAAIKNLKFREIGPATMGGRVDDVAVVERDPRIVYVGLAGGGLWKTTNAFTTWHPIDNEPVSSIGAVAVAPSDPSVVWVGTGEANNRQSSSWAMVCTVRSMRESPGSTWVSPTRITSGGS